MKNTKNISVTYTHLPLTIPDEGHVVEIEIAAKGLIAVLEAIYPPMVQEHHSMHYSDLISIVMSIICGEEKIGYCTLYVAHADTEMAVDEIDGLTYLGHFHYSDKVLFIGTGPVRYEAS